MPRRRFFDLPVYRLPREKYYHGRDKFVDDAVYQTGSKMESKLREMEIKDSGYFTAARDHLQRSFGGCWEFNEIIGYIRLHFLGSQIRGEYFAVAKQRLVKTRTKTFEWRTWKLAPEIDIEPPYGCAEVLVAVRQYIANCSREVPGRFVDSEGFEHLAPHINWAALYRSDANLSFKRTPDGAASLIR